MAKGSHNDRDGLGGLAHLARRFFDAVSGGPIDAVYEQELLDLLSEPERSLYDAMGAADRGHAVSSASYMAAAGCRSELVVASALHDVGKIKANLGTVGRVAASVVTLVLGRDRTIGLAARSGLVARVGTYADHPRLGAEMLASAESSDVAVTWAREHHWPLDRCSLADRAARLLWDADRA